MVTHIEVKLLNNYWNMKECHCNNNQSSNEDFSQQQKKWIMNGCGDKSDEDHHGFEQDYSTVSVDKQNVNESR